MVLITAEIKKQLPALYAQEQTPDPICFLKLFTPDASWRWHVLEGSEENGDWTLFCKVVSPMTPEGELGYVMLSELERIRGPLGLAIERDLYWTPKPLSQCK